MIKQTTEVGDTTQSTLTACLYRQLSKRLFESLLSMATNRTEGESFVFGAVFPISSRWNCSRWRARSVKSSTRGSQRLDKGHGVLNEICR